MIDLNKILANGTIEDGVMLFPGDPRLDVGANNLPSRPPMVSETVTTEQLQLINAQVAQQKLYAINNPGPRQYFNGSNNNEKIGTGAIIGIALAIGGTFLFLHNKKKTPKKVKL